MTSPPTLSKAAQDPTYIDSNAWKFVMSIVVFVDYMRKLAVQPVSRRSAVVAMTVAVRGSLESLIGGELL